MQYYYFYNDGIVAFINGLTQYSRIVIISEILLIISLKRLIYIFPTHHEVIANKSLNTIHFFAKPMSNDINNNLYNISIRTLKYWIELIILFLFFTRIL